MPGYRSANDAEVCVENVEAGVARDFDRDVCLRITEVERRQTWDGNRIRLASPENFDRRKNVDVVPPL